MRIVFMGTPEYAIASLDALIKSAKHQVVAVVTQQDKPSGRGHVITPSPVKLFAAQHGIKVYEFDKLSRDGVAELKSINPDIMITVAYGQLLSGEILSIPKYGVINAHASLLPKYRGASPISAAIADGETETGITIMQTELSLDTGAVLLVKKTDIKDDETTGDLSKRLSVLSGEAILEALDLIESGKAVPEIQSHVDASYCNKLTKNDSPINWKKSAKEIVWQIRAQNPFPISSTMIGENVLKIYKAKLSNTEGTDDIAGTIIPPSSGSKGLFVQCGAGVVEVLEACLPGGKIIAGKNLINGGKIKLGDRLGTDKLNFNQDKDY